MELKRFGKTDTKITAIGQGTMGVGGYFDEDRSNDAFFVDMLRMGIGCGMTLIDTAEAYGAGHSEELVGRAVKDCRKDVFVATKVSPQYLGYNGVLRACERSLRRLQTEYIDSYQIHWPNPAVPIEETLKAMGKLVEDGKVRHVGVSNFSLGQLKRANEILKGRIASIQIEYNLFDRIAEIDIIPYCEREGITVLAYSPLDQGRRLGHRLLLDLAMKYGKTVTQVVLRWLTKNRQVVAVPKAITPTHIKENAMATDFDLEDGDIESISQAFAQPVVDIPTDKIRVSRDGLDRFTPGPEALAKDIMGGETIKPVRVIRMRDKGKYVLAEGRLRYWAWVFAHDGRVPIPALVREEI